MPAFNEENKFPFVVNCDQAGSILSEDSPWIKAAPTNLLYSINCRTVIYLKIQTKPCANICNSFCACYWVKIHWTQRIAGCKLVPLERPFRISGHHVHRWRVSRWHNCGVQAIIDLNKNVRSYWSLSSIADRNCCFLHWPENTRWRLNRDLACSAVDADLRLGRRIYTGLSVDKSPTTWSIRCSGWSSYLQSFCPSSFLYLVVTKASIVNRCWGRPWVCSRGYQVIVAIVEDKRVVVISCVTIPEIIDR